MGFPVLRVLGGALLVLAGVFAYSGITFGLSAALVLVLGGAAVLAVAFLGHRPRPGDIAIFVIGVLVLGAVSTGYTAGPRLATYSATKTQVPSNAMSITITSSGGSVSVGFANRGNFGYEVNFTNPLWFPYPGGPGVDRVTNSTVGGVFNLNIGATFSSVSLLVGSGYAIDLKVTDDTGSIDLAAPGTETIHIVSLTTSTGSVSAVLDSSAIESLVLKSDTGSVSLVSHRLGAAGPNVPVTLSTSTGSIDMTVNLLRQDAASITASTNLGSINPSLSGFTITQNTRTNLAATTGGSGSPARSFVITSTTNLGSVDITAGLVSG
jgi:hypothetical protein